MPILLGLLALIGGFVIGALIYLGAKAVMEYMNKVNEYHEAQREDTSDEPEKD